MTGIPAQQDAKGPGATMSGLDNQAGSDYPAYLRKAPEVFALLVLLLTLYNTLPFFGLEYHKITKFVYAKVIAVTAAYFVAKKVALFVHVSRRNGVATESRYFLGFFVAIASWFAFWLLGLWPGYYMTDSYATLWRMYSLSFDTWFSPLHPLIYLVLYQFLPNAVVVPIFQLLLASWVAAYALAKLHKMGVPKPVLFLLLPVLLLNVPVIALTLLVTRDTIFSLVLLLFVLWIFFRLLEKREIPFSLKELGLASAAVVFLSIYRGDGIALLPALPLVLRLNRVISTGRAVSFVVVTFLALQVSKPLLLTALAIPDEQETAYTISLMMNPLGYLLQNNYASATPETDRKVLGMLIDVDKVKEASVPYEIPAFWSGYCKFNLHEIPFSRVRSLYGRMIMENKSLFLENRLICFAASTGMNQYGFTYADMARDPKHPSHYDVIYSEPRHSALFPALYGLQSKLISSASRFDGLQASGRFLHWNLLPALALAVLALVLCPWFPVTASASLLILSRVPLVFLAAPAGQFKYYYSLYLFGLFVVFLLVAEKKVGKERGMRRLREQGVGGSNPLIPTTD